MQDGKYRAIFSKNLKYYMDLNKKTQNDIIRDLGINKSAISTWCNGTRLPRMDKVDLLARYCGIKRSDLIEDKSDCEGAAPAIITTDESAFLAGYRSLNAAGRQEARSHMDYLCSQERYKKDIELSEDLGSA